MTATLRTRALVDVQVLDIPQVTTTAALPMWRGLLHGLVGPAEVGKSFLACHAVLDVARTRPVLVLDGEMSAGTWRRRLEQLGAERAELARVHYAEMAGNSADVALVRATVADVAACLVVWDSALSLITRTARSENDNAEVGRVFDRLREIVRDGPAGLVVDHTSLTAASLVSRGASAKFAALDVSYGVRLVDGSVPGPVENWASTVSVEKDRHGVHPRRVDRDVTFIPLGDGMLGVDIIQGATASHRLSAPDAVTVAAARIAALQPPPKSGNDAFQRIGGTRAVALAAFKRYSEGGTGGTGPIGPYRRTTSTEPVRTAVPPAALWAVKP